MSRFEKNSKEKLFFFFFFFFFFFLSLALLPFCLIQKTSPLSLSVHDLPTGNAVSKGSFLFLSMSVLRASKSMGVIDPAKTASVNSGATCFFCSLVFLLFC